MGRGYSGVSEIEFPIYREINGEEHEFVLKISGRSYFSPGVYHGLPENCYPDEGDTEIVSITFNGKPFLMNLTSEEESAILEQIENSVKYDDGPDYDDYKE